MANTNFCTTRISAGVSSFFPVFPHHRQPFGEVRGNQGCGEQLVGHICLGTDSFSLQANRYTVSFHALDEKLHFEKCTVYSMEHIVEYEMTIVEVSIVRITGS